MTNRTRERQQRALPGAIRADQRPALALPNLPVNTAQDLRSMWYPDVDSIETDYQISSRVFPGSDGGFVHQARRTTGFTNDPIWSMRMVTSSPSSSVNSEGGTMPVAVIRSTPAGNSLFRSR